MEKQDIVYGAYGQEKIQSAAGMAALIEEHADAFGGASRLATLMDIAIAPTEWNYLATMLSLDILDGLNGKPARVAGDISDDPETECPGDFVDEGAEPPYGMFP